MRTREVYPGSRAQTSLSWRACGGGNVIIVVLTGEHLLYARHHSELLHVKCQARLALDFGVP